MKEDFALALELICLTSNIRKVVCKVLDSFLSFLKKYDERNTPNMLALMLNPRFKDFHLVSLFIGCDQEVAIVEVDTRGDSCKPPIFFIKKKPR